MDGLHRWAADRPTLLPCFRHRTRVGVCQSDGGNEQVKSRYLATFRNLQIAQMLVTDNRARVGIKLSPPCSAALKLQLNNPPHT